MEKSTAYSVDFFASIDANEYQLLSTLRTWTHLEMGQEENTIWLKNFNLEQINSTTLLQLPFVKRYYAMNGKLFLYDQLLPEREIPKINWQRIDEKVALTLPSYNFNFFGLSEKIKTKVVVSNQERSTSAVLTTLPLLLEYLSSAPAIRYKHLEWALINYRDVFLLGTPLLPIPGKSFWQNGDSFLPAGYDFEFPMLNKLIPKKLTDSENKIVVWNEKGNYFFINREDLNFLDLAAVRKQKI